MIYEEPDILATADWSILTELNSWVLKDPSYPLPEGYIKVKEKEVTYDYKINPDQGIPEEIIICSEILD